MSPAMAAGVTKRLWEIGDIVDMLEGCQMLRRNRRARSWGRLMRVKIFDLSWNVDLNRLGNEINAFLARFRAMP